MDHAQKNSGGSTLLVYRAVDTWDQDMMTTASVLLDQAGESDIVPLDTADLALALSGLAYRCLFYGALVRLMAEGVVGFDAVGIKVALLRERLADGQVGTDIAWAPAPMMKRAA